MSSFANVAHAHAGEEITSGTVAEPRIEGSIARDAEVINTVKDNNVRVHDYFTAASASAVSFRFGGQSSMTFYTAINPSAEFEVTSGNQVITTAMLRID